MADGVSLAAIVLAAGRSERMGRPKALLPLGSSTFVGRVVDTFAACPAVRETIVVLGYAADEVERALAGRALIVARNPAPERGQLSSLVAGLDRVAADADGVLVALVDTPLVRPATVNALVSEFAASRALIVRPVYQDRHGHPVIFARTLFDELRHAPESEGAKAVVRRYAAAIAHVVVDDEGVVLDVDTPAEYRALTSRAGDQ